MQHSDSVEGLEVSALREVHRGQFLGQKDVVHSVQYLGILARLTGRAESTQVRVVYRLSGEYAWDSEFFADCSTKPRC